MLSGFVQVSYRPTNSTKFSHFKPQAVPVICGEGIPARGGKWNTRALKTPCAVSSFSNINHSIPSCLISISPCMMCSKGEQQTNDRPRYQTVGFAMFTLATVHLNQPKANPNPCSSNSLIGTMEPNAIRIRINDRDRYYSPASAYSLSYPLPVSNRFYSLGVRPLSSQNDFCAHFTTGHSGRPFTAVEAA